MTALGDGYIACICEGHSEMVIMDLLLDGGLLEFGRDRLLDKKALSDKFFRNPRLLCDRYIAMDFGRDGLDLLLVQDRKNARYKVKGPFLDKIASMTYAVTAPEIEMLMIHSLELYGEYKKRSSKMKPSDFLAESLKTKKSVIKSRDFIEKFYSRHDLTAAIREHKRKSQPLGRGELFLADLLL